MVAGGWHPLHMVAILRPMPHRQPFTVARANAMVPWLESVFARLDGNRVAWTRHFEGVQILEVLWGEGLRSGANPDHAEFLEHRRGMEAAGQAISQIVERDILGRGLRFPSGGLENGIVDFPTTFEGRWVYLCWQRGEPQVSYWHELGSGFRGRQDVAAEHVIAMGQDDGEPPDDAVLGP